MQRSSQQILDEWLVTCSQAGDKQAFERLLQRWQPRLLSYAQRQLRDKDGAYDVVQECLLTVAKGIKNLNDPAAFPNWIYRILHNKGCDWISARQRQRRDDQLTLAETDTKASESDNRLVQQGLGQLAREHYLTVYFFYIEEFSLHEIAVIMDVPPGTVKSRLFTARKKLAQLLDAE